VAHNAIFDLTFLNAELERAGRHVVSRERLVDTLMLARRKYPGGSNRLDDLCLRYRIDNSRRVKHGALLDAELLSEVYVELIGARQAHLRLIEAAGVTGEAGATTVTIRVRPQPLAPRIDAMQRAAHRAFIATLGVAAVWRSYIAPEDIETRAGA
jgi:DNA polymerase-3 subunit epsilon